MTTATIHLHDLQRMAKATRNYRSLSGCRPWFCAVSRGPFVRLDCFNVTQIAPDKVAIDWAIHRGLSTSGFQSMDRGHITGLIERTRWLHGLPEIRKTWNTGIRALLAESRYVLEGGAA